MIDESTTTTAASESLFESSLASNVDNCHWRMSAKSENSSKRPCIPLLLFR